MNRNMKKTKKIVTLFVLMVMVLTMVFFQGIYAQATSFSDIKGHWALNQITSWIEQGLVSGYPDGTFKPDREVTRAEFVSFVNRMFKFTEMENISFSDVKAKDWYYNDIAKAKKAGYLDDNGTVAKPNAKLSRQEAALMISKLMLLKEDTEEASKFSDAANFAAAYKGYIGAVKKAGYMNGYPDGSFKAERIITRAETITILNTLAPNTAVKIDAIADQSLQVGASGKVALKATPADAKITVASSDVNIATAVLNGSDIDLKGVAAGSATITLTAKRIGYLDGTLTFKVTVASASSTPPTPYIPPSNPPSNPSNTAPVITVVEPDGVNDGIISLTVGSAFTAPTVTANDAENGNITSRIVKVGENLVNTSKVGEYVLTYNVTDLQGLAAAEKKVTVKVLEADITVNITVDVADDVSTFKNITVNSSGVGTRFKVEGSGLIKPFGQSIAVITSAATRVVSILDANGNLLGTVIVNVGSDSTANYTFKIQRLEAIDATANITVSFNADLPNFKEIKINSSTAGTRFKVQGSSLVKSIGESIVVNTAESSRIAYILDNDGNVLGTITVNVGSASTANYPFKVQLTSAVYATARISVDVQDDITVLKNISVISSTAGTGFKAGTSTLTKAFGQTITVETSANTCAVYILDSNDVIGTIMVDVSADRTNDYIFQIDGAVVEPPVNSQPVITVVEPDGVNDGIINLAQGAAFVAPTVTASDAEDGNITSRIVKTGEAEVNTAAAGTYVLTYNVTDLQGLAAAQKTVTVIVSAAQPTAKKITVTVNVAEALPMLKDVTVTSDVGTQFKVEPSTLVKPLGQTITISTISNTTVVTVMDANGTVLGTATINVAADSQNIVYDLQ